MDMANDMPEERSSHMADSYYDQAEIVRQKASAATDATEKQTLMDRYERLLAAGRSWAERYTISTGYAHR